MTNIHHVAAEGFALCAASYVAGRPDYPPEIEGWLSGDLGLGGGKTALDLAAGTGKFSPRLLATGAHVIAVEPVREMLDELIRQFPQIDARTGSAQHIPLDDASVDPVVSPQAFHSFSTPEPLRNTHPLFKPAPPSLLFCNPHDA